MSLIVGCEHSHDFAMSACVWPAAWSSAMREGQFIRTEYRHADIGVNGFSYGHRHQDADMSTEHDWSTFGKRLRWARENCKPKKMTQKRLAELSGLSQPSISDIENDEAESSGATASLAHALKVSPVWLERKRGLPYDPRTAASEPDSSSERHLAPVVGDARLGLGGSFDFEEVEPGSRGYVLYKGEAGGSALYCRGNSMRPKIVPGDYVVILPHRKPQSGDTVSCETRDGQRMIKILHWRRDGQLELTSVNETDQGPIRLDEDEVASLYYAIGPIKPDYHQESLG